MPSSQWRHRSISIASVFCMLFLSIFVTPQSHVYADYTVGVYPDQQYQAIQGWGSSMAWWANIIGGWSDTQRTSLADALYDPVKGIGLNVQRYNIGADTPGNVCHNQMREGGNVPAYEPTPGNYDWTQDANQRWFLQAAQARGANVFEGFSNSAPAWMLNNSCTAGGANGSENLSSANYGDFANYLTTVSQHFHDTWGIPFQTVEPFNEPSGTWWTSTGNQEGMFVSQGTQNTIVNKLGAALTSNSASTYTNVAAPDDYAVNWSINDYNAYDSTAKGYLEQWNTHGYSGSDSDRGNAYSNIGQSDNKRLWMSEWGTGSQGSQIAAGITLSKRILEDENYLHPSAWVIWQAVNEQGDSSDSLWGLAYRDSNNNISYPSRYYAMGNYSKFIRPGYKMIGNSDVNTFTAYNAGTNTLVIVTTNSASSSTTVTYDLSRFSSVGSIATPYQTSASENLQQLTNINISNSSFSSALPASSITTFVIPNVTYTKTNAVTEIDDSVQGSGQNQFNYSGNWQHCTGGCWNDTSGLYNGSNSWDATANDQVTVQFSGSRIRLYGVKAPNHGIGLVSVDNSPAHEVDFYAATRAGNQLMWESPSLNNGSHILTLRVTGNKNPQSTGAWVVPDRVEIDPNPPTNLIANPGFESGNLNSWVGEINPSLSGVETNYPHSGTYDAYLHPTTVADVGLIQSFTAPSTKTYTMSAYAATNMTNNVQVGIDVAGTQIRNITITANVGYSLYSTTFSASAGQTIKFWYYSHPGSGWATLDDVSIT